METWGLGIWERGLPRGEAVSLCQLTRTRQSTKSTSTATHQPTSSGATVAPRVATPCSVSDIAHDFRSVATIGIAVIAYYGPAPQCGAGTGTGTAGTWATATADPSETPPAGCQPCQHCRVLRTPVPYLEHACTTPLTDAPGRRHSALSVLDAAPEPTSLAPRPEKHIHDEAIGRVHVGQSP